MKRNLILILMWGIALALGCFLFKYSIYLAATRIYQVDECQNVFIARILATGQTAHYFSFVSPLEFILLWIARGATQSAEIFASSRCLMLIIFWLNLLLMAIATGERLFSRRFPIVLVAAITLAPLWDYGFEIRDDNLILTGLLLFWCLTRNAPAKPLSCLAAGAITVALQFTAFKAFVYTVPLSLLILFFPTANQIPRWKLILFWMLGAAGIFLLFYLAYSAAGLWRLYVSDVQRVFADATGDNRFTPWFTLERLLTQTPLLLATSLAGIVTVAIDLYHRGKLALDWNGWLPEAFLLLITFAALMANPTPYPYNLLNLVPFIFLFVYRYAVLFLNDLWKTPAMLSFAVGVFIFAHLTPFAIATRRHLDWSNLHQVKLMNLAESLTDPTNDPVYDGIGMVPTRPSIHFHWFLHSLNIQNFESGKWPSVQEMLAAQPAAVIIESYRTDWLPKVDRDFITNRYVPVSDDFRVLGKVLPKGGGAFEIYHPGRYRIATLEGSDLAGTYPGGVQGIFQHPVEGVVKGTLDGVSLTNQVVKLTIGSHRLECSSDCQPTVVWVGPKLNRIGRQSDVDHRLLFVNWY